MRLFVGEELPDTVEDERCWRLARVHARRDKNCGLVEPQRTLLWIALRVRKQAIDQTLSFVTPHLCFRCKGYELHRPSLTTVVKNLPVDVDRVVPLEPLQQFLCFPQRLLERVRVGPREVGRIRFGVEVCEGVGELDLKVFLVVVPGKEALAPLPLP